MDIIMANNTNRPLASLFETPSYVRSSTNTPPASNRNVSYSQQAQQPYTNWLQLLQSPRTQTNTPRQSTIDYGEEIIEEPLEEDTDEDNWDTYENNHMDYYKQLLDYKNKTIFKHEQNNDSLRVLFKNVVDQQDKCQRLDNNVKSIQQNEIDLHEKQVKTQDKEIRRLKKSLVVERQLVNKHSELNIIYKRDSVYNKQRIQCVVCKDKDRNVMLEPCKHIVCCKECAEQLPNNQCPNCRALINSKQNVYIS